MSAQILYEMQTREIFEREPRQEARNDAELQLMNEAMQFAVCRGKIGKVLSNYPK